MKNKLNMKETKHLKQIIETAQEGCRVNLIQTDDLEAVLQPFLDVLTELNKMDGEAVLKLSLTLTHGFKNENGTFLKLELDQNRRLLKAEVKREKIVFCSHYLEILNFKDLDLLTQRLLKRSFGVTHNGRINLN